jgi:hypothetical protein
VRRTEDLGAGRILGQQVRHLLEIGLGQHPGLWKRQPEDRIVGHRRPVDQLVDDIGVRTERQDRGDGPEGEPLGGRQRHALQQAIQVTGREGAKSGARVWSGVER